MGRKGLTRKARQNSSWLAPTALIFHPRINVHKHSVNMHYKDLHSSTSQQKTSKCFVRSTPPHNSVHPEITLEHNASMPETMVQPKTRHPTVPMPSTKCKLVEPLVRNRYAPYQNSLGVCKKRRRTKMKVTFSSQRYVVVLCTTILRCYEDGGHGWHTKGAPTKRQLWATFLDVSPVTWEEAISIAGYFR